jgi:broad specificity phosphatase PhoE
MHNPPDRKVSLLDRLIGSSKVTSVVLIRHCETGLNAQGLIDGHSASELTARGRSRAKALRFYLNSVNPKWFDQSQTKWLVSSLRRVEETAALLIGSKHEIEKDFWEVDVGHVQGAAGPTQLQIKRSPTSTTFPRSFRAESPLARLKPAQWLLSAAI